MKRSSKPTSDKSDFNLLKSLAFVLYGSLVVAVSALAGPSSDEAARDSAEKTSEARIKGVPPRDVATKKNLIDLSDYYNGSPREGWLPRTGNGTSAAKALPIALGVGRFEGIDFDVRGLIQLSGTRIQQAGGQFPEAVKGIKADLKCKRLHFLHGAGWAAEAYVPLGSKIGSFVVHYADSSEREIPIITGEDLRDWVQHDEDAIRHGEVVWKGKTPNGLPVRVFRSHWDNPQPEVEIKSIDYVSKMTDASPFLIAVTGE